jgi:hypothetical protein
MCRKRWCPVKGTYEGIEYNHTNQTDAEKGSYDMLLLYLFLTFVYLPLGIIFKLAKGYM